MLSKFLGCMLSAALGDSLGASFSRRGEEVLSYTDDTAMMIALVEAILECGGELDPRSLAWKFVEAYEREPWRGYGPGPPRIFKLIKRGEGPLELDKRLYPGGSLGNGGAMRVAPIGLLYHDDPSMLGKAVELSCKPTHNHPLGVEGALIEAAAVAIAVKLKPGSRVSPSYFIEKLLSFTSSEVYEHKLKLIPELLETNASEALVAKRLGRSVEAYNSVPTAIYCYLKHQDPLGSIRYAISLGGDRDTIACMAGAIAGAHRGVEPIPESYLSKLENRRKIEELAERLYRLKSSLKC